MSDDMHLDDLAAEDRDTAEALVVAFSAVRLSRPDPAGSLSQDAETASMVQAAFEDIRMDGPTPANAVGATQIVVLPAPPARRRHRRNWLLAGAAAVLALAMTVSLSSVDSSVAWATDPAVVSQADRDAAAAACGAPLRRGLGDLESPTSASTRKGQPAPIPEGNSVPPESLPPLAVLDIRGDGALAVYQDENWQVACLLVRDGDTWVDQGLSVGPGSEGNPAEVLFSSRTSWVGGESVSYLSGGAPSGTARVSFALDDGTTVQASVMDTTFAAWFPGYRAYVPGSLVMVDANGAVIG